MGEISEEDKEASIFVVGRLQRPRYKIIHVLMMKTNMGVNAY